MSEQTGRHRKQAGLWEEEFSISTTEQGYVERRQLGRFLLLTSAAMFAGQLWLVAKGLFSKAAEVIWPRRVIARVGEIPVGATKIFQYPGPREDCLLVRVDETRYVAYSQKCTHLSCAVIYSAEHKRLECPCHEGYFSLQDGHVLQGPPPRPLPKVELEVRDGEVVATKMTVFGEES